MVHYELLANERRKLMDKMNDFETILQGRFQYTADIGERLVFLKYYLDCCRRIEESIMSIHGVQAYTGYYEKYSGLNSNIALLLKQVLDNTAVSTIITAGNHVLHTVRRHIEQFDISLKGVVVTKQVSKETSCLRI